MCNKYKKWKTNNTKILKFINRLPLLSNLPPNKWLSNIDIDTIL